MARSDDPRHPIKFSRGAKRYHDIGSHVPPGDDGRENTRDHERIWFELRHRRSCCDCDSPGFKYCFQTFDYPSFICDGDFPGGDTLRGYWPGVRKVIGLSDGVWGGCGTADLINVSQNDLTAHDNGSWRNGPFVTGNGGQLDLVSAIGWNWANRFPAVDWTLEFWLKPSSADIDGGLGLISHGLAGESFSQGGLDVNLRSNGAVGLAHIQIAGGEVQESGPGWFEPDQWHHVAVVRNTVAKTIAIFINGRIAISRILPTSGWDVNEFPSTPTFWIAGGASWSDIAAYDSALSPTAIRRHYQAVYGVEGAANPFASVEGDPTQVEDPTKIITEQISIDVIDGGGDAQAGSIVVSQGDYAAYVTPEDSPFELEERKGQPDGYAALDGDGQVPENELGVVFNSGRLLPVPTALNEMVQVGPSFSDDYVTALLALGTNHYPFDEASAPYAGTSSPATGTFGANGTPPSKSTDRPLAFFDEDYLLFDDTDGLKSSGAFETFDWAHSFWLRVDELPASAVDVFRHNTNTNRFQLLPDGTLQLKGYGGTTTALTSPDPIPVGEWVHIIVGSCVGFSAQTRLWVNGVLVVAGATISSTGTYQVYLGGDGVQMALAHFGAHYFKVADLGSPTVLALYQSQGLKWQVIPEIVGGAGGIDASEDDVAVTAAPRTRLNFKAGANVTLDVVDDEAGDEVEVTIAASLTSAGDGIEVSENDADTTAAPRTRLNFKDGFGTYWDLTDDSVDDEVEVVVNLPDAAGASDGDVITLASGVPIWLPSSALPDYSGASEDDVLTIVSGVPAWAAPPAGGGGGAAGWDSVLDLPLSSTTDWVMPGGWSNDGSKMIVGVNSPQTRNKYGLRIRQDISVFEVEIQMPSSGRSAGDQRVGVLTNWNGSNTGFALYMLRWASKASGSVYSETDAVTAGPIVPVSGGLALDVWHKLRVVKSGVYASFYVNGSYHSTTVIGSSAGDGSFLALYAYQIDAYFRNLKIWSLTLPA